MWDGTDVMRREFPILLLDIDGALSPLPDRERYPERIPNHVAGFDPAVQWIWTGWAPFDPMVPGWLARLGERCELVWATTWEDSANEMAAPDLGLPTLPTIRFSSSRPPFPWKTRSHKLPYVAEFVGDRPVAWIDDAIGQPEWRWANSRAAQTLLVETNPLVGIVQEHVERIERWAGQLSAATQPAQS